MAQPIEFEVGEERISTFASRGMASVQPAIGRNRGIGPFARLILRGATIIDGSGAPPWGPVDIVVSQGRISEMVGVGTPMLPIKPERRPPPGDHEIDCHGKYVTPGLIDCHGHIGAPWHATNGPMAPADYVYKLWLAHGVTTVREAGSQNGLGWTLQQKAASAAHAIAAPNIQSYAYFPAVNDMIKTIHTPQAGRDWLRRLKDRGADGVKFFGAPPAIMQAALDEARTLGLRTCCHHAQMAVSRMNALTTARWGLTSAEHYYGLPEALFEQTTVQAFASGYNYADEYHRFSTAGRTFAQAAKPGSQKWNDVLEAFLATGLTFVPTFNVYDANRDLMRIRRADWHAQYTDKTLWSYFQPQRGGHGAYWYNWTTQNEIEWRETYRLWMHFINDYKNRGGRVCAGSDSGFMYAIYGFGLIRELEILQEAGFHPLEVLQAATSKAAELLGIQEETGTVEVGKRADLLVHSENPLDDFKLLYGSGTMRLNDTTRSVDWRHCLETTIKDGLVFDTEELLADIRDMVAQSHAT